MDADAQSYLSQAPQSVLAVAKKEKRRKYVRACEERRASFTPLCFSVDGMPGKEAETFLRLLGSDLAAKWDKSYGVVMQWIRVRLSFAILRATNLCIRGSRTKWRGFGIVDGTTINLS